MPIVPTAQIIARAYAEGYAVPSFCAWDAAAMAAILSVAEDCRAPVLLMFGGAEFRLMPPEMLAGVAREVARRHDVPAAVHLDHGRSLQIARECVGAGFGSVMLDYSDHPFAENVEAVRRVVELARPQGVAVEAELGSIGRAGAITQEGAEQSSLTDPEEAARFVEQTGVDMLAVAVGNAHGLYTAPPQFRFDLLAELREAAGVPLVLHGGSGTPEGQLRRAVPLGIAKVNVASELVQAVREEVFGRWQKGEDRWVPIALRRGMDAMAPVVERWLRMTGAAGRA